MRFFNTIVILVATLTIALLPTGTEAHSSPEHVIVPTDASGVLVERVGDCPSSVCPAVLILGGSRGFASPAYREIGQTFRAAGLDAYLVHVLSPADLDAIAKAESAQARVKYYAKRLPDWISRVQQVAAYLKRQPRHGGKVAILGISLGAQIASAASVGRTDIDALVLVDGGLPNGYSHPIRSLPPLLLIWGSADRIFPLSIARALQAKARQLGKPVILDVYKGGGHDFFLKEGTASAQGAHRSAADFLAKFLAKTQQ